jgi:hypothetical protein
MSLSLAPSPDEDAKVKGGSGSSSHGEESQPQRVLIEESTEQTEKLSVDDGAASATSSAAASSSAATAASASSSSSSSSPSSSLRESFVLLAGAWFAKDSNAAVKRYYNKWNIQPTCHMHRWRYTQSGHTRAMVAVVIANADAEWFL